MLVTVRYVLPAVVVLGGILVIALVHSEGADDGGAAIIGAGLAIYLLNWLYRVGASGDRERQAEDDARAYFDKHGHWPDEEPR
jgi:hypothetical protein